jgi:hypothetical protein
MQQTWISWIVVALVAGSVAYELATGKARVRGMGVYLRCEKPGAYWLAVILKGAFAAVIAAILAFKT